MRKNARIKNKVKSAATKNLILILFYETPVVNTGVFLFKNFTDKFEIPGNN